MLFALFGFVFGMFFLAFFNLLILFLTFFFYLMTL